MKNSSNENNFVIESYNRSNELKVKQLIDLYNEESYLFHLLRNNKTKCAYVAYCKKDVVGIFFTWGSNFHPFCTYFRIYTNPFYSELHIEQYLLSEIQKRENFKLPLQISIWETSAHLKNYYEQNNFMEIRRTYMPILDVQKIIPIVTTLHSNYAVQSLSNILSNNSFFEKLTHLVKTNYEDTHLANPVTSFPLETWKEKILADDTLLDGSFVLIDEDNEIIAYSFIQGEFDSTSIYAMELLKAFPFNPCATWITYQKEVGK
ncbi:GNAT family acetyltransferase [Bacillus cereus group sp. Bc177]|uniref:GNAT family acetyltransferase n=1 Tax=Bacillus cereus group sp. Bc177 TaxID=3018114 RepID=UPI0022E42870|nr:GNAT family acetyltransferase [Bacillus cereus group sp. Bc177]MDA2322339.1 GNAT family acetyltransferase [Bacillus cereus group sp. Bc177]